MLYSVQLTLDEANNFVQRFRHHARAVGHRFSIGVVKQSVLCGVAIVGRPVARLGGHPRDTLEVSRLCTDGTRNAPSFLYATCVKIGTALGYQRIQTYTLPEEGGASLRASGWVFEGVAGGGQWAHSDGKPRRTDQPTGEKWRWARALTERPPFPELDIPSSQDAQLFLPSLLDVLGDE